MWVIAKRELSFYFSHIVGYLVVGSYLTINNLFLWFFDTHYQLLNSGFGYLNSFFEISPVLFLFLIPALSMRSFSEEYSNGTIELLITKPLNSFEIFGGKFIGIALIIIMILLSSSINILAVFSLMEEQSKFDWGSLFLSYLALLLLCLTFLSMSLWSSIIFRNQVSSFLMASLLCFGQFFLWDLIAYLLSDPGLYQFISDIGIQKHYLSLCRGILRLEDVIYFLGLMTIFLILGIDLLKRERTLT